MRLDGPLAEPESPGHLPGGEAFGDELEDLALSGGEAGGRLRGLADPAGELPDLLLEPVAVLHREDRSTRCHRFRRGPDVLDRRGLLKIAVGAGSKGLKHRPPIAP